MKNSTNVVLGAFLVIFGAALAGAGIRQYEEQLVIRAVLIALGSIVINRGLIEMLGWSVFDCFKKK